MKKISLIILSLILAVSCLAGCDVDEKTGKVEEKKVIENVKKDVQEKIKEELKEDVNKSIEVLKCKDNEVINSYMKDFYENDKDFETYTKYPNGEHIYSVHVNNNGQVDVIYLKKPINSNNMMYEYDLVSMGALNTTSINATANVSKGGLSLFNNMSTSVDSIEAGVSYEAVMDGGIIDDGSFNTSEYHDVKEGGFLSVKNNPLSTFAADSDTASYSNIRNILRNSVEPNYLMDDLHDVRIEEMLNYFDYNINYEDNDGIFSINSEIAKTPWNPDSYLLTLNIKADEIEDNKGSNLVFLVDTSGSMFDVNKLPLLQESLKLLVENLTEKDLVSIVTYSGSEEVLLEAVNGNEKDKIIEAIDGLEAHGSTNGESGLKMAYKVAERNSANYNNNRIIMCSDGDLNVGMSSEDALHDFVSKKREIGIYLSVLGFGTGNYKDTKMEVLADNGNGNYYYIDSILEGRKVLVDELTQTLVTAADDVKFQLEFNPKYIKAYRKIGYENRNLEDRDFEDDTKDGGEIGHGMEAVVVYEIVPEGSDFEVYEKDLKYQQTSIDNDSKDWLTLSIRYKDHGEKESKLIEYVIDENSYSEEPSDTWKFISNVVGFGLILNDSDYKEDLEIEDIVENLENMYLDDKYKVEFLSLTKIYDMIDEVEDIIEEKYDDED